MQPRLYAQQVRVMLDAEIEKWGNKLRTVLPEHVMELVDAASESFMSGSDGDDLGDFPIIGPSPHNPDAA